MKKTKQYRRVPNGIVIFHVRMSQSTLFFDTAFYNTLFFGIFGVHMPPVRASSCTSWTSVHLLGASCAIVFARHSSKVLGREHVFLWKVLWGPKLQTGTSPSFYGLTKKKTHTVVWDYCSMMFYVFLNCLARFHLVLHDFSDQRHSFNHGSRSAWMGSAGCLDGSRKLVALSLKTTAWWSRILRHSSACVAWESKCLVFASTSESTLGHRKTQNWCKRFNLGTQGPLK